MTVLLKEKLNAEYDANVIKIKRMCRFTPKKQNMIQTIRFCFKTI